MSEWITGPLSRRMTFIDRIHNRLSAVSVPVADRCVSRYSGGKVSRLGLLLLVCLAGYTAFCQPDAPRLRYTVSILRPADHTYDVDLQASNWKKDTIRLKMPGWMPGYYQLMNYARSVENIRAIDSRGATLPISKLNDNTWVIAGVKNRAFRVSYAVRTAKQFVANSYVDDDHAYIIPENTFLYADGFLGLPVSVRLLVKPGWGQIATGLDRVAGNANEFTAPDFDILYDCPILAGTLQALPAFKAKGVDHRFIGYAIGEFDRTAFMGNLKKVVEAAIDIIGDVPFSQYTFIGIGPGRGGIEHLNNTTISFDGTGLDKPAAMMRTMNFIAHEYFHHYNVKRIRPVELGPFDYDKGNRTNLLWISEGLTVYYEYLIVKKAGLADAETLLVNFSNNLNTVETNPGRLHQSLQQASYNTWQDGPFGTQGSDPAKSISYYEKGPLVGLLLDFSIRNATQNKKTLDDVMRLLYWKYYKQKQRGFTEAEFQAACEEVAGSSLTDVFEYVYTTKEPDYAKYLAYAGLSVERPTAAPADTKNPPKWRITRIASPTPLQRAVLASWLGE